MCNHDWSARFGATDAHGSVPNHFTTRSGCALTPKYVATGRQPPYKTPELLQHLANRKGGASACQRIS